MSQVPGKAAYLLFVSQCHSRLRRKMREDPVILSTVESRWGNWGSHTAFHWWNWDKSLCCLSGQCAASRTDTCWGLVCGDVTGEDAGCRGALLLILLMGNNTALSHRAWGAGSFLFHGADLWLMGIPKAQAGSANLQLPLWREVLCLTALWSPVESIDQTQSQTQSQTQNSFLVLGNVSRSLYWEEKKIWIKSTNTEMDNNSM